MTRYFPPVPKWQPTISQPFERIVERLRYYSDLKNDLVFFRHGTCAIFKTGRSESDLRAMAQSALKEVFTAHPDMNPHEMDDGNMLIGYGGGTVANVVLRDFADAHWNEIDAEHLNALAESEVLITPLGPNVFNAQAKRALFGRCFMFMDAQDPEVVQIVYAEVQ